MVSIQEIMDEDGREIPSIQKKLRKTEKKIPARAGHYWEWTRCRRKRYPRCRNG